MGVGGQMGGGERISVGQRIKKAGNNPCPGKL